MSQVDVENSPELAGVLTGSAVFSEADSPASELNRFERILTGIEVIADGVTVAAAVGCGYATYYYLLFGNRVHYPLSNILLVAIAMAVLFVILLDRDGAYNLGNSLLRIKETERALRVSTQAFLLVFPVIYFTKSLFPRLAFLFVMFLIPLMQVIEKQLLFVGLRSLQARGFGMRRVIIYGAGYSGKRVFSALVRSPQLGLDPVVMVDDNPQLEGMYVFESSYRPEHSIRVISGPVNEDLIQKYGCGLLVIAIPDLAREKYDQVTEAARAANVRVAFLPARTVQRASWTEHADIDGILLSVIGRPRRDLIYEIVKRGFDLFTVLAVVVLLSPVWLLIALLVKLDSPGPVLFRQLRIGMNGKPFSIYKFRSMFVDAPKYAFSPEAAIDPRITRVGRFLRRTSLDELPQVINVLNGDMSLVGPRPEMPFIVGQYTPVQCQRLQVLPGITGLWQLSADRASQIHENLQYDMYYIRNRSFFMDLAVLLHTAVFAMRGV
jgi:exopolysaccharide biosynthesis polyprenyl glycosylphosphotransferase